MRFVRSVSAPPPIDSAIDPAPGAATCVGILTACALISLFWVGIPFWLRLLLALLCVLTGALSGYRLLRPRWRRIRLFSDEEFSLIDTDGTDWPARIVGRPFVSPFYIGFRWRGLNGGRIHALGIFRGQVSDDAHRRLVTRLRYHQNR